MNILDIICLVFLGYALYRGLRSGLIVELSGIIALLLGVWVAFSYGETVGVWLGLENTTASVGGFLLLLVAVVIFMMLLSRLLRGMVKMMGLGLFDKLGGALVSMFKTAIVLSLLLGVFLPMNAKHNWVDSKTVEESYFIQPIRNIATQVFPYFGMLKNEYMELLSPQAEDVIQIQNAEPAAGIEIIKTDSI